jgi:ribosomal-protein-alanine N-acetyltransferase
VREAAATPAPTVAYRAMHRDDLAEVLAIEHASFPSPWPRSAFELAIAAPDLLSIVASDERVRGYLVGCPDDDFLLIANVAVHRKARRKGLGQLLIEQAIERAQQLRLDGCTLDVRMSNAVALRLYDRLGFVPEGIRRGYYEKPAEDALHMRLRFAR